MKPKQKQQGDVLFQRLAKLPSEAGTNVGIYKMTDRGPRLVLAEGEATGHAHILEPEGESDAQLIAIGERMLLKLSKGGTVTHEEHKPVRLEAGIWQVGRVREYDYLNQVTRAVAD